MQIVAVIVSRVRRVQQSGGDRVLTPSHFGLPVHLPARAYCNTFYSFTTQDDDGDCSPSESQKLSVENIDPSSELRACSQHEYAVLPDSGENAG